MKGHSSTALQLALKQHQKDLVGAAGGVFMAICLLPQLLRMYQTRSATDLSYSWTATYIIGLSLTGLYLFLEGATVGWVSTVVEVSLAWVVLFSKVYLDAAAKGTTLEDDIIRQLPASVAVATIDAPAPMPILHRMSKSFNDSISSSPSVPLLSRGPAQHGGCHVCMDYVLGHVFRDKRDLPRDRELSQQVLEAIDEAVAETDSSRLRFKHVEHVTGGESEPDASEGFSLIAITGQGHITAEWFAGHSLLSIGLLSTCQGELAAKTRRLGLELHRKLTVQFPSLFFVKASSQLVAELQS